MTIPVDESTAKALAQDCAVTEYVIALFVPSASVAEAVISATVPAPEFSAIVLESVSESLGAPTSNSS